MMETDTHKAFSNFMKTTGFTDTNNVPKKVDNPPLSQGQSTPGFVSHYNKSNPSNTPVVPGQIGPKSPSGQVTPYNGLIPGHLPQKNQLNHALIDQNEPYPNSDLLGKVPFTDRQPSRIQDWRATGIGPESDRISPGNIAESPPEQGRLQPPFTGNFKYVKKDFDGPMPQPSKVEKMLAGNYLYAIYVFGAATMLSTGIWARTSGEMWGVVALLCAAITISMWLKNKKEGQTGAKENFNVDHNQLKYDAKPSIVGETDTSAKQIYRPRKNNEPDPNPYPKPLDSQTDTQTRLDAQGMNQSNVEGPRNDYWYKRGPTPENRARVKNKDLMRNAKQYNMNERDLEEYMARLDGEAPDQFYQAHPYMPFSANWEHRQTIDDTDTIHGIAGEPGTYNRKWAYRDPKIQQAGAKTMHTKDPPPGSNVYLNKVHPWMEPKNQVYSKPFDIDEYTEFMSGNSATGGGSMHQTKVTTMDAGRVAAGRQEEDAYYQNMYGTKPKDPDDLPPGLEPIPTSREGIGQRMKDQKKKRAMQVANQTDRQMNYVRDAQGYGYTVVPPHPNAPVQVPPTQYTNNPPYSIKYSAPNQMPSPDVRPRPVPDMIATAPEPAPVSLKEKTEKEFASAFASTTPDDDIIQEAISAAGRARR